MNYHQSNYLIMQVFQNITALLSLIKLATVNQQFVQIISDICEATANEQQIYTIIYASDENVGNVAIEKDKLDLFQLIQTRPITNTVTVMSINSNTTIEQYARQFNRNLLSIVQLSEDRHQNERILDKLWQRLDRNRQSGLILLFEDSANDTHVGRILSNCVEKHAINVIALQPKLAVTERSYWTLKLFPKQQTIRRIFSRYYRNMFPKQLENMHGNPLRILENGWYPQMYNFTPKQGSTTLSGYLGRALAEYAYRRNATITSPYPQNNRIYYLNELCEMLLNNSADTGPLWPGHREENRLSFSNELYRLEICLMIPLEKPIPKHIFYHHIFHKMAFALFIVSQLLISCILSLLSLWRNRQRQRGFHDFCNISALEGLLGMPFSMTPRRTFIHKLIYITISFGGLNISAAYNAYLQSFNVDAPIEPLSKSIDDVIKRGIKLALDEHILPILQERDMYVHRHKFTLFRNSTELLILRDNLDTRYAFVADDIWDVYEEQQKYFSRPLFRLTDICFRKGAPMVLPFNPNSMYRESITDFMGRLLAAGLIKFWLNNSFIELVAMKIVLLEDRNKQEHFKPMKLADLQDVIIIISVCITTSLFCFLLEIHWQKVEKHFKSMIKIKRRIIGKLLFSR